MTIPRSARKRKTQSPDPPYVFADTSIVTARSGRDSQLHIVRCPWEPGVCHVHRAPLAFESGRRKAPCGRGSYHVVSNVLGVVVGGAAA